MTASVNGPFLIAIDTEDKPGKIELVFVRFERRIVDAAQFHEKPEVFDVMEHGDPYPQLLKRAMGIEA